MRLSKRKSKLTFVTDATVRYKGREREIVVEPNPQWVNVRLSGTRTIYSVSWVTIFHRAAENAAMEERERRKAGKRK